MQAAWARRAQPSDPSITMEIVFTVFLWPTVVVCLPALAVYPLCVARDAIWGHIRLFAPIVHCSSCRKWIICEIILRNGWMPWHSHPTIIVTMHRWRGQPTRAKAQRVTQFARIEHNNGRKMLRARTHTRTHTDTGNELSGHCTLQPPNIACQHAFATRLMLIIVFYVRRSRFNLLPVVLGRGFASMLFLNITQASNEPIHRARSAERMRKNRIKVKTSHSERQYARYVHALLHRDAATISSSSTRKKCH